MPAGESYRQQADAVLEVSATLTDEQKLMAEFFDHKIFSLGFSTVFTIKSQNGTLMDFVHLDYLHNLAAVDAGIVVWQEKTRWDAVRPFSAIRHLYGDEYAPPLPHCLISQRTADDLISILCENSDQVDVLLRIRKVGSACTDTSFQLVYTGQNEHEGRERESRTHILLCIPLEPPGGFSYMHVAGIGWFCMQGGDSVGWGWRRHSEQHHRPYMAPLHAVCRPPGVRPSTVKCFHESNASFVTSSVCDASHTSALMIYHSCSPATAACKLQVPLGVCSVLCGTFRDITSVAGQR